MVLYSNNKFHPQFEMTKSKMQFQSLKKKWIVKNQMKKYNSKINNCKILQTFQNLTFQQILIANYKTAAKLSKLKIKIINLNLLNKKYYQHIKPKIKMFNLKDRRKLKSIRKDNIKNHIAKFKINKIVCLAYRI